MNIDIKKIAQLSAHSGSVYALENGNSDHTIFSGAGDNFIAEWNLKTLTPEKFAIKLENSVYSICHIREKSLLIAGLSNGGIHVIDLKERKEIKHFTNHKEAVFDIQYASTNDCFYVLSTDGSLSIWKVKGFELLRTLHLSDEKLRSIAFNKDEDLAAIACGDGSIRVLEMENHNEIHALVGHEKNVNVVAFHPNGKFLISGGRDAHLNFWHVEDDFKLVRSIPAHNFAIYSIVFSNDGKVCATGSRDKTIKIWDAESFDLLDRIDKKSYDGHINSVNKILWHDYNNYLISTGDDRAIMVWDIQMS